MYFATPPIDLIKICRVLIDVLTTRCFFVPRRVPLVLSCFRAQFLKHSNVPPVQTIALYPT